MTSSFDTAAAAAAATAISATAVAADPSAVPVLTTAATSATTASPPATTPDYHYSPSNTEPDSDNYDDYASEHSSDYDSSDDYDQDEYDENGQLIEYLSDAQAEWEESIAQIQRLLTCILIPVVGKFFGRRFSYFLWGKYVNYKYGAKVLISDKPAFDATTAMHSAVVI